MSARLFKDMTAGDAHTDAAIGGDRRRRKTRPKTDRALTMRDKPVEPVEKFATVLKVDDSLGLVLGWAIVCKHEGEDYYDLQDDLIPESSMLEAAVDFMSGARTAKEMHKGEAIGSIVFAFPLTGEIAKAFGIETATTGLMVAMKPSPDVLEKFKSGEFTGFSIGGRRIKDEIAA